MLRKRWYSTRGLAVLTVMLGLAAPALAATTATLTVGGAEQQVNGSWDQGNITLAFNGFIETAHYGEFSSPASIASALAGMFSRDYVASGLCAKASGATITFQLKGSATFGPLAIGEPTSSFQMSNASGWTSVSTAGPSAPIIGLSLSQGPVQMGVVITGPNLGSNPSVTLNGVAMPIISQGSGSITVQVPTGATSGNVVVTVNGVASNGATFTVVPPFGCN